MCYFENNVWKSSLLERDGIGHAFSTRLGGESVLPHTASMNVGFGRGDGDGLVRRNIEILCGAAGVEYATLIGSPQYHTSHVRYVTEEMCGEGITKDNPAPSDAYVTDRRGVSFIIRTADCVPILLCGRKRDGAPVAGAAHAGWKGTVALIAKNLADSALSLGAERDSLCAAIGPCIKKCCFEVKEDFIEAVTKERGAGFAFRHIAKREGGYFADLVSMNVEILLSAGVAAEATDVCPSCTACEPDTYHSHRATRGLRGTMGSVIGIK